jgi:hypothetical protein
LKVVKIKAKIFATRWSDSHNPDSTLIVEERRKLGVPLAVNQREFSITQFCPGAGGAVLRSGTREGGPHLPVWVRLKLSKVVNRAQQPCCDEVLPPAPGLGGTWVHDLNDLVCIHRSVSIRVEWEIFWWDERNDGLFDCLCIRLSSPRRDSLGLMFL